MHDLPPLAHRFRFLGALIAWGVLALASPGVLTAEGLPLLAVLGIGIWGHVEARPYKGRAWKGFVAHALGTLPGAAAAMLWIRFVYPPPLAYIGLGYGVYSAAGGIVLRRLLARMPGAAPLGVGLVFTGLEALRAWVPMPFGLGWMRMGYHTHVWLPVAASARVWGVTGLSFVLAAMGGWVAYAWRARARALSPAALLGGFGPLVAALGLGALTAPPELGPGPRVLVVQPGFEQKRKQYSQPRDNFRALMEGTWAALEAERAAGAPEPDLVAWGESMLYIPVFADGVRELAAPTGPGLGAPGGLPTREQVDSYREIEDEWVRGRLFGREPHARGREGVFAPGTSFLAGCEVFMTHEGAIRRQNGAVLYDAEGRRSPHVGKRYLVPGAETMYGLEQVGPIRSFIQEVSGYIPDFLASPETGVLRLTARDGRAFDLATTICFDNAHLGAYTDPVAAGDVDFHVVASNEAWYEQSFEADQMVAFTRIAALASGRAILRATNSGISLLMLPDGSEVARITQGGRAKMVSGYLALDVPVPAARADSDGGASPSAGAPPIARLRRPIDAAFILLPLALLALPRRRREDASGSNGNPPAEAG